MNSQRASVSSVMTVSDMPSGYRPAHAFSRLHHYMLKRRSTTSPQIDASTHKSVVGDHRKLTSPDLLTLLGAAGRATDHAGSEYASIAYGRRMTMVCRNAGEAPDGS